MNYSALIISWGIFVTMVLIPYAYFIKRTINQVDKIEIQITDCKVAMAEKYISKTDFKEDLHRIEQQLDQIYNLLQSKQDK